jgi:5-methyltetrahydrofolate--homocysteine methyltransferase
MSRLLEALRSGRVLLMDGAMGTELRRAGLGTRGSGEVWNLTQPERVRAVHRAYVDAGAEVLLTNTFQAHKEHLTRQGLEGRFTEIWQAATAHARSAAAGRALVLADLGPFDLASAFHEGRSLATACAGCDGALVETLTMLSGGPVFLHFWSEKLEPPLPFLLSFTFLQRPDGKIVTARGETPEQCAWHAERLGIAALGVNCGKDIGLTQVVEIVRQYRQRVGYRLPLFVRPNAGTPRHAGDELIYPLTPEMLADGVSELLETGVSMIGGCCGTTPAHIAAIRPIVDAWNRQRND